MENKLKNRLDKLLEGKGWTRYRLSKESGVSKSAIYNLFKKEVDVSADSLIKIADALGVTIDELIRS